MKVALLPTLQNLIGRELIMVRRSDVDVTRNDDLPCNNVLLSWISLVSPLSTMQVLLTPVGHGCLERRRKDPKLLLRH
jgi:hypothetical protein